ncbi:MAG: dihydrolipoamide acetyltransferase family protein [Aggregatilineales bacterium]
MAETITLPQLGMNMREGTFLNWTKQVGDKIAAGDAIAEIESDKATIEVPSPNGGVLLQTLVNAGDVVQVGAPIAVVGAAGETAGAAAKPAAAPSTPAPAPTPSPAPAVPAAPTPVTTPAPAPVPVLPDDENLPGGTRATPLARKMAEERRIDLRNITGTGPSGRITKADVEAWAPSAPAAPVTAIAARTPNPVPIGPDIEEIPLSRLRARIGSRMAESKQTTPHFYVTVSVDMGAAMALRKQINESLDDAHKVSVNDLVVKAVALTLRQFPNLNTHFYGDRLIRYKRINIGIAVAMDGGGLINVVAKDADRTPISQIAARNKEMFAGARTGKVKPDDIENSTFTISNLGPYDVDTFTAIINPPEAGIIAVGTVQQVPVVVNGAVQIGMRMNCTLSADHRVTDGAEGAQFMQAFKKLLESPMRLLI